MEILSLTVVAHTFVGFLLLSNDFLSDLTKKIVLFIESNSALYRMVQILLYLLDILLIVSLCVAKIKHKACIWYSSIRKVVSNLNVFARLLLFSSSLLAYVSL